MRKIADAQDGINFANSRRFLFAFAINLAGFLALWYFAAHDFFSRYDPGYEGASWGVAILGSLWAAVAVWNTLCGFVQFVSQSSVTYFVAALALAIFTFPISLAVNYPSVPINPIVEIFTENPPTYQITLGVYFALTVLGGLVLTRIVRSKNFDNYSIVWSTWSILVLAYLVQIATRIAIANGTIRV